MITNLDIAKKYFKEAKFNDDTYDLDDEWQITWIEGELFVVDRFFFDSEVGYVTRDDIFSGDFRQCLEFCLGEEIVAEDVKALEEIKKGV